MSLFYSAYIMSHVEYCAKFLIPHLKIKKIDHQECFQEENKTASEKY